MSSNIVEQTRTTEVVVPAVVNNTISSSNSSSNTTTRQVIEKPAVLHETIRKEEVEEIQPVIHREYERTKIIKTTVPLYDKEIKTPVITQNELAAQYSKSVNGVIPNEYDHLVSQAVDGQTVRVQKAPIIVESERHVVIEEYRPVICREIVYPSHVRGTYVAHEGTVHVDESYRGLAHQIRTREVQGEIFRGHSFDQSSYHHGQAFGDHTYGANHHYGSFYPTHSYDHFNSYPGFSHLGSEYHQGYSGDHSRGLGYEHQYGGLGYHPYGGHDQSYGSYDHQYGQHIPEYEWFNDFNSFPHHYQNDSFGDYSYGAHHQYGYPSHYESQRDMDDFYPHQYSGHSAYGQGFHGAYPQHSYEHEYDSSNGIGSHRRRSVSRGQHPTRTQTY